MLRTDRESPRESSLLRREVHGNDVSGNKYKLHHEIS